MTQALANHLWQSTLFACAAWILTVILRRNRAAVRHGLWLAASIKFLVPFSLLIGLGSQIQWQRTPVAPLPRFDVVGHIREPITMLASPAGALAPRESSLLPVILIGLFGLWLGGFTVNSFLWWRRWRQIRASSREGTPMHLSVPIPAISSAARLEPGVFGIFRPFLLLPYGLRERLSSEQFEAIVAHELCHVRRRDNLWSAIHMVVESLFWFHPLVWLIRSRLIEERERACDEEVLGMGGDPQDYAKGIVTVCEFYLKSPLACVSGVTGSNLRRRVEAIMLNRVADRMNAGRKLLLVGAGVLALAGPVMVGIIHPPSILAQEPAKPVNEPIATSLLPAFEVASIKPSAPDSSLKVVFAPGGKLIITNATLRFLIKIAYDIGDDQLSGGAGWVGSRRFDLEATPEVPLGGDPKDMTPDQIIVFHKPVRLRLQRLLAERFQLQLRKESTTMPIFALVIAKNGPKKLTATKTTGGPQMNATFGAGVLSAVGVDMPTFAKFLSEGQVGRPVVDMTALKGKYDFHLDWAPDPNADPLRVDSAANQAADRGGISIFTALQQQLGLKLDARVDTADRLVVTRAELPSAN